MGIKCERQREKDVRGRRNEETGERGDSGRMMVYGR